MSIPLPPLPQPASDITALRWSSGDSPSLYKEGVAQIHGLSSYTADQLRARDQEIVRCVLKAAEMACGHLAQADAVAAIIRALEFTHHE